MATTDASGDDGSCGGGGEPTAAERRAAARERLRARTAAREHAENEPGPERLGDHLIERPWLGVALIAASAAAPGLVGRALNAADDDGPPSPLHRDIGLHDFVAAHPRLCLGAALGVCVAGVAAVAAFLAGWF